MVEQIENRLRMEDESVADTKLCELHAPSIIHKNYQDGPCVYVIQITNSLHLNGVQSYKIGRTVPKQRKKRTPAFCNNPDPMWKYLCPGEVLQVFVLAFEDTLNVMGLDFLMMRTGKDTFTIQSHLT
jgi:hypothetical protein